MRRRTKIIATLGPATDQPGVLEAIIRAGVNVVRVNFSHGNTDTYREQVSELREVSRSIGREVALLGDLQGPKIRIRGFKDGTAKLVEGQDFYFDISLGKEEGDDTKVGVTYQALVKDVNVDDVLLLDDGRFVMHVTSKNDTQIHCKVVVGGNLTNNKGINRQGGGLSADALTEKDLGDIKLAAELGVDYLAVSFPRDAADIDRARALLRDAGSQAFIVAKIERAEAVTNIDEIIAVSDAVMVARGDLGVEIGDAELPAVQKMIIAKTREQDRVAITATQMMESMILNSIPTRAEVSDVANAVIDGTDAIMLSAETAMGEHPVKVIEAVNRVCLGAENNLSDLRPLPIFDQRFQQIDEAIAKATMYTANHMNIKAIIALTESGSTALWMSRVRSGIPIYALTRHVHTLRRVTLYRGVYPFAFDVVSADKDQGEETMLEALKEGDLVASGDWVVFTRGDSSGTGGGTNMMKIVEVL